MEPTAESSATESQATESQATVFDRFARFYDADYRDFDADVPLILEMAEGADGPVLELGCGTGRLLAPLAAAGHSVTGVDISPALLALAERKLSAQGLRPRATLIQGDLRTFSLPDGPKKGSDTQAGRFAFAFCASNTFMHLNTPQAQLTALEHAAHHLAPGGVLLLDLFNPDIARLLEVGGVMELADQWLDPDSGAQVLKWSVRLLDLAEQIQDTTFIYEEVLPGGEIRRTVCPFSLRYLWRNEAELMLARAGLATRAVWGDFDGNPYDSGSERLILLAEKV
ncbi:MAG: class I SAM-dependent methyltransferase [Litorilinea sp.]